MRWRASGKPVRPSRTKGLGGERGPIDDCFDNAAFGTDLADLTRRRWRVADPPAVAYNVRHAPAHLGLARGVGGAPDRRPGPVPGCLAGSAIRFRLLRFSGQPHRRLLLPGENAAGDGGLLAVPPSVRRRTRFRGAAVSLLRPPGPCPAGPGSGA